MVERRPSSAPARGASALRTASVTRIAFEKQTFPAILVPLGIRGLAAFQKEEAPRPESLYRTFRPLRLGILGLGLNVISHPRPPFGWGGAKGVPRLPRLGFPPWTPPFRGAPSRTRNPQGGKPILPHANLVAHFVRLAWGPFGGGSRAPRTPGRPSGHALCSVHLGNCPSAPSRGLPRADLKKIFHEGGGFTRLSSIHVKEVILFDFSCIARLISGDASGRSPPQDQQVS